MHLYCIIYKFGSGADLNYVTILVKIAALET